jgi:hypothetical protein
LINKLSARLIYTNFQPIVAGAVCLAVLSRLQQGRGMQFRWRNSEDYEGYGTKYAVVISLSEISLSEPLKKGILMAKAKQGYG